MFTTPPSQHGITLIEILITITIVGIMSGTGFMVASSVRQDQMLNKAIKQVRTGLYEAKQNAVFGKKPPVCTNLQGYQFFTDTSHTSFTFKAVCKLVAETVTEQKTIVLDPNVTVTGGPVEFSALYGATGEMSDITFSVQVGTNTPVRIIVTPNGDIKEEDASS